MVLGLSKLMAELGMKPQIIATGTINLAFAKSAREQVPGSKS